MTPKARAFPEHCDFSRASIPAPLWEGRRGQIANLWLYAYCAILSPFILPIFYAAWRAINTYWHRYEVFPARLRITTGLYRPHIHTEEVDFETVVRCAGRGISASPDRPARGCGARAEQRPESGAHRGDQGPASTQDAHRWGGQAVTPATRSNGVLRSLLTCSVRGLWISPPGIVADF